MSRKNNNFTLGAKRHMSRAEIKKSQVRQRQNQPAPTRNCERCGEDEDLKLIPTGPHGEVLLCFHCRRAHALEWQKQNRLSFNLRPVITQSVDIRPASAREELSHVH